MAHPFAFVSGLVGLGPTTGALATGGAYGQTVKILSNFTALLQEQGWSLSQLVVARLLCTSLEGAAKMKQACEELFADELPPARTSVVVAGLPWALRWRSGFSWLLPDLRLGLVANQR